MSFQIRRFLKAALPLLLMAVAVLFFLGDSAFAQAVKSKYDHYWLPDAKSTYAPKIDGMFDFILWLTLIVFFLVEFALVWFLWKYRHRPGHKAKYYHGNNKLEIAWTIVPAVILTFLAIFSNSLWSEIRYPGNFPKNADQIRIKPRQFEWDITYPGADKKFDTPDDVNTINQLYLVENQPAQIFLQAQDVIHSFFVPEFRIKQDAVPGMKTSVWIDPSSGNYEIGCAELCGAQHYRMKGYVTVVSRDSVNRWLTSQAQ